MHDKCVSGELDFIERVVLMSLDDIKSCMRSCVIKARIEAKRQSADEERARLRQARLALVCEAAWQKILPVRKAPAEHNIAIYLNPT